jgi:hypothetical protein
VGEAEGEWGKVYVPGKVLRWTVDINEGGVMNHIEVNAWLGLPPLFIYFAIAAGIVAVIYLFTRFVIHDGEAEREARMYRREVERMRRDRNGNQ